MGAANLALVIRIFFGLCTTQRIDNAIAALQRAAVAVLIIARPARVGRSNAPGVGMPVFIMNHCTRVISIRRAAGVALHAGLDHIILQLCGPALAAAAYLDVAKTKFVQTPFFVLVKPYITRISP